VELYTSVSPICDLFLWKNKRNQRVNLCWTGCSISQRTNFQLKCHLLESDRLLEFHKNSTVFRQCTSWISTILHIKNRLQEKKHGVLFNLFFFSIKKIYITLLSHTNV